MADCLHISGQAGSRSSSKLKEKAGLILRETPKQHGDRKSPVYKNQKGQVDSFDSVDIMEEIAKDTRTSRGSVVRDIRYAKAMEEWELVKKCRDMMSLHSKS